MPRLSTVGRQILVFSPDKDTARVTTVGIQMLVAETQAPVRVTSEFREVLIKGLPDSDVRMSTLGVEALVKAPTEPVRVTSTFKEVLIQGLPDSDVRMSTVGVEALMTAPTQPVRVTSTFREILEVTNKDFGPGRLQNTQRVSSMSSAYLPPSVPQSDLYVSGSAKQVAVAAELTPDRSDALLQGTYRIVSFRRAKPVPEGRLYSSTITAALPLGYLTPDIPQSELTVAHAYQQTLVDAEYVSSMLDQSNGQMPRSVRQASIKSEYLPPDAPQSDMRVANGSQTIAYADDYDPERSTLRVDRGSQLVALVDDSQTPDSDLYVASGAQLVAMPDAPEFTSSDLDVTEVSENVMIPAEYLPAEEIRPDYRIMSSFRMRSVPAGWLEFQVTLLRLHGTSRILSLPLEYPDPATITAPVEVTSVIEEVAINEIPDPERSALFVTQMITVHAQTTVYSKATDPQTELRVTDIAMLVVEADDFFEEQSDKPVIQLPIVSTELIY